MMQEWCRGDFEMSMLYVRAMLNQDLKDRSYDADGHNICLARIFYKDGTFRVLAAYSNDSEISESTRLRLHLIPSLYTKLAKAERFGCDGRAQYHTEPKLLNYLCANPSLREGAFDGPPRHNPDYRWIITRQRNQAKRQAHLLKGIEDVASITLVTEIDCCKLCTKYSIERFRAMFPIPLEVVSLGKRVRDKIPAQFKEARMTTEPKE